MALKSLLFATLLASTTIAATLGEPKRFKCGTRKPTPKQKASLKQIAAAEAAQPGVDFANAVTDVPVYVHVIAKSESASDGYMSSSNVRSNIQALNDGFNGTGFQFTLQDTDWTVDSSWSENGDDQAMKRELRKGGYGTLNLYYQTYLEDGGVDGFCTFPDQVEDGSYDFYDDGCNILFDTEKTTTTHEVGHWFGLLHTFEGGCSGDNDHISDTPACKEDFNCRDGTDSCPDQPGLDPIYNYMGYTSCPSEFTAGQSQRMNSQWSKYRA